LVLAGHPFAGCALLCNPNIFYYFLWEYCYQFMPIFSWMQQRHSV
jgi:hypothetical protein